MSKKILLAAAAVAFSSMNALAGGLLTNTNQNAAFLRQMSQDGIIDITGLYSNPAGTAFLSNGWHLSLNVQSAYQHRDIETTFPLFAYNLDARMQKTHKFEGKASAPVIPSFQLSYNQDKWSVSANFALGGGGGKCEFDKGLGSFEALYAGDIFTKIAQSVGTLNPGYVAGKVPGLMAEAGMSLDEAKAAAATMYAQENFGGYSLDAYMKGRQYYFGLQLGATYKVLDNLAVFGGLRGVYASCNYTGYVQNVQYIHKGISENPLPANSDLKLDCDQTGFGITPILGIDWKMNDHWNFAAKYEFKTRLRLENDSQIDATADMMANETAAKTLGQFADGKKVAGDIPGILALGTQYSPISAVRFNAGFHYYMDKAATAYGDKQKLIDKNTWELTAGAEYDVCKWATVSASWQRTKYGMSDAYMNDLSFNVPSNAIGVGFRVKATDCCNIDLGYMHCFYQDRTVNTVTAAGVKTDLYSRTNDVFGLGVNLAF